MKSLIKIMLLLLLPAFVIAQQNPLFNLIPASQVDSFKSLLNATKNDTLRMEICRTLSMYYIEVKRDSCLYYAEQRLALARQLQFKLWEAEAYDIVGVAFGNLGNYPRALQTFLQGLKIAENEESEKNIWQVSRFALNQNPRIARLNVVTAIYNDMGLLYGSTGNIDKQISSHYKAMAIARSINDYLILSLTNMNLGLVYLNLNKLDSALAFEQKALEYSDSAKFFIYKGLALSHIGNIYLKKGNYPFAKKYLTESIQINQEQNNNFNLTVAYISTANLYLATQTFDSSLLYAKKALENCKIIGSPEGMLSAFSCLYSIYKSQDNTDSAFAYLQLANAIKDSLNSTEKAKQFQNIGFDEQLKVQELEKEKIQSRGKIRTYTLLTGVGVFMLIAFLLYRNNRNRIKANKLLQKQKEKIELQKKNVEGTLAELKSTQAQLIQSEKMASLGELTAGIAHEIQNPLNFVNNFSEVNKELLVEMKDELKKGNIGEVNAIANDIIDNEEKINHHGKRADAIVKGMLQHSRTSSSQKELTDINALCDEYLRLAYHGLRAKDKTFNAKFETNFDPVIRKINVVPQEIGRVILNLINNAFYAVSERQKQNIPHYEPTVTVKTKKFGDEIEIRVIDNGNGIPKKMLDKIFQPFFTTKPTGQGTGLGLSLAYEIITKGHGGELSVKTTEGNGSEFIIMLPANN